MVAWDPNGPVFRLEETHKTFGLLEEVRPQVSGPPQCDPNRQSPPQTVCPV